MNFNLGTGHDNEYKLFRDTTKELINLYGVYCKYIITEKINQDKIFGEHSHIKVDKDSVFEFFMLPSETDNWGGESDLFSKFGMQNLDTITMFVARDDMEEIHPEIVFREGKATIENLPNGNLVVFPNNKIMEVTSFKLTSEDFGNNNVFTSDLTKNVYKIVMKTYIANHDDYSKANEITHSENIEGYDEDFGKLASIFDTDEIDKEIVTRAEEVIIEDEVIYPSTVRKKPVRNKVAEDNPFGSLG